MPYGKEYVPDPRFGVQPAVPQAPAPVERDRSADPVWDPTAAAPDATRWQAPPPVPPRQDLLPSYGGFPPPPPRTGMPTWAKVLIGVSGAGVGLVVLLVIAAVAIPVFLSARENGRATTTASAPAAPVLPETVSGLTRLETPETEAMVASMLKPFPEPFVADGAIYGDLEEPLAVVTVAFPVDASEAEQAEFREAALRESEDSTVTMDMTVYATGVDDAWFGCTQAAVGHICLSTQSSGAVVVVSPLTGIEAVELSRAAHAEAVG